MKKRNLIIANWKMAPETLTEAREIFNKTKKASLNLKKTDILICPPFVYLEGLLKIKIPKNIKLGAQNISSQMRGAFTGEISGIMLKNLGVTYVIVGHSERRGMGETDEVISQKMRVSFDCSLIPILCVGEKERDRDGTYLSIIKEQLKGGLSKLAKKELVGITIAYEPVWAIGKSYRESMSPTDIHEMSLLIKKSLGEVYGQDIANSAKILYGGSVEKENTKLIMEQGNVAGLLVGHASLNTEAFGEILKAADVK